MEKQGKKEKTEEFNNKVNELENKWKRALADYQNLEKRLNDEKEQVIKFANFGLIYDILPVLDSLEEAENYIKDNGLDLCIKKFKDILKGCGVIEVECLGRDFNADTMEAIDMKEGEQNKVLKIHKKGYMLRDKVLRPAQVIVGRKD